MSVEKVMSVESKAEENSSGLPLSDLRLISQGAEAVRQQFTRP